MSCEFNDCAECEDATEFGRCCCGALAHDPAGEADDLNDDAWIEEREARS